MACPKLHISHRQSKHLEFPRHPTIPFARVSETRGENNTWVGKVIFSALMASSLCFFNLCSEGQFTFLQQQQESEIGSVGKTRELRGD